MSFLSSFYPQPVVPNAIEVTASGSNTARTLSARFADIVNVKDFGAAGDGVTDDAPAIRAALTYALTKTSANIVFPNGTYNLGTYSDGTSTFTGVGQKEILPIINTTTTYRRFLISGNGSTITTSLYPTSGLKYPQSSYLTLWNIRGKMDVFMQDLNMVSHWSGGGARGLIAEQEARTVNPWGIATAIGLNSYDPSNLENTRTYFGRVENFCMDNCQLIDWTQGIVVNRCGQFNVRNSYFAATWGTASCGTADPAHTACLDIFISDEVTVEACRFVGCIKDDFGQIPTYTVAGGGVARFRSMDNAMLSQCCGKHVFSNNIVEKFDYEGVLINQGTEGSIISNNVVDNKRPSGSTNAIVNQNIRINGHDVESPVTGSASTNIISDSISLFRNGDQVQFVSKTGGSGVSLSTTYYVVNCDVDSPDKYKLSTSLGGSPISLVSNITSGMLRSVNKFGGKALVSGNVIHYGGIYLYGAQDSIVSNNIIQLPSRSTVDFANCSGIAAENRQNTSETQSNLLIENNMIFGANIPTGTSSWDGTIGSSGANPNLSCGMVLATGSFCKTTVKNNSLILYSKDNPNRFAGAVIVNAEATFIDNYYEGWDYVYGQFGGPNARRIDIGTRTKNIGRISAEGQVTGQMPVFMRRSEITFYPTETGWYRLLNNSRRSGLVNITLGVAGDSQYGSNIDDDGTNQRLQHTVLSFGASGYSPDGTAGLTKKQQTIVQHVHTSTETPIVSKVKFGRNSTANPIWIYVNVVTSRWELTFSGGGGSNAAGYANIVNGAVSTVTITNSGSGYTSPPTVTLRDPSFNPTIDVRGSGATFTAVLSGNTISSVTVNTAGSGYASGINIICEADWYDLQTPTVMRIFKEDPVDSVNLELAFQQGTKSITRVGGFTNGSLIGTGAPIVATTAPASTPEFIGQQYIDTDDGKIYMAVGTSSSSNWKEVSIVIP